MREETKTESKKNYIGPKKSAIRPFLALKRQEFAPKKKNGLWGQTVTQLDEPKKI